MTIQNIDEKQYKHFAKGLGIDPHQRYDENQATEILKVSQITLNALIKKRTISFVQVSSDQIEFFGFQLVEYLIDSIVDRTVDAAISKGENRILRFPEVREMTGLSRTTLWRLEKEDKFPHHVQLGKASVGWRLQEVQEWIKQRSRV